MKKTCTRCLPLAWQQRLTTMLLVALLSLCNSKEAQAQYFQIAQCSGTPDGGLGTNVYGPMNSVATANATSRTAIIYPASQLAGISGSPLSAIYFYRFSTTGTMTGSPNYKIYLKEVSASDWGASSVTWATEIATATLVYDGNPAAIVGSANGWKAFPFTSNFNYSGTQNLAVLLEYTNTAASTAITWTYEYTASCINTGNSNTTKYINNTTGTPGATLSSANYRRPYVGFDVFLTCYPPTGVTGVSPTTTTATISWTPPAAPPASGYEYYYSTSSTPPIASTPATGSTLAGVTTANIAVTASSTYYVWVRSVCSGVDKSPWSVSGTFSSVPANDEAASALPLTVNADLSCGTTASGTTFGALQSADAAPGCSATGINDDVWYSFVATGAAHQVAFGSVSAGTMVAALYTGTPGNLTPVASACASTTLYAFGLTPGTTYYVRAYTSVATATTRATFTVCAGTIPPPPLNNECSGAVALTPSATSTCGASVPGITDWASQSADAAPSCSATGINDDVWYSFVATGTDHTVNITGATNATAAAIYTGACGALTQIPNVCGASTSGIANVTAGGLTPGTTYYVRVYSTSATVGTFSSFNICVLTPPVPACPALSSPASAAAVNGTPTLTWAVSPYAATYDLYLDGNATPTTLYATNITALSYVVTTALPAGTYYWYVVAKNAAGTSTGCTTNIRNFVVGAAPGNDLPVNATTLTINTACTGNPYTNANATQIAGEPWAECVSTDGFKSVWFKFVAPAGGAVKVTNDFTATLGDSRIALFSATDPSNFSTFNVIACDDDNGVTVGTKSVIYATGLIPSQTYYVVVDGLAGATAAGPFCLEVQEMTSAMISTASTCATTGQSLPARGAYTGWSSITSSTGLLLANVKRNTAGNTGATEYSYANAHNVNIGAVRSDATGLKYMDRNYRIAIGTGAPVSTYDVRLFFLSSELTSYTAAGGSATLGTLGVTRQTGEAACNNDFAAANGAASFIGQDASGTIAGGAISWIEIETPGFSNFFMNAGPVPLPVDLTFTGKNEGAVNKLNWITTREQNFSHFELQRSADGIAFSKVAVIDAKGFSTGSKYDYTDERPFEGLNIYRLNLVDKDGKSTLSNIVKLVAKSGSGLSLRVYPNPVKQQLQVAIAGKIDGAGIIQVLDITGKILQTVQVSGSNMMIDMSHFAAGMYMIRYTDNTHNTVLKVNKN